MAAHCVAHLLLVFMMFMVLGAGCAAPRAFTLHPPRPALADPELTFRHADGHMETIRIAAVAVAGSDRVTLVDRRLHLSLGLCCLSEALACPQFRGPFSSGQINVLHSQCN
jgi:hypothetical protein